MNIFILDKDIKLNAQYHCNSHVIKMPVELCQIMCTNLELLNLSSPIKSTHKNHPSTIWARETYDNFLYTFKLCQELCYEYTHRYNKVHQVESYLTEIKELLNQVKNLLPNSGMTPFALAMPKEYIIRNLGQDEITMYRDYYIHDKLSQKGWRWEYKNRNIPEFAQK